jgi:signal transduction histidine kinase
VKIESPQSLGLQQIPLRRLLVWPFVLQIFVAVGLTSYLSLTNGRRAVNQLAEKVQTETTARVQQHLDNYLAIPAKVNQINVDAVQLGLLNLDDFSTTGRYFWKQMRQFDLGYINYANRKGDFIGIERLDDGQVVINEQSTRTGGKLKVYQTNTAGDRTQLQATKTAFAPLSEAWYTETAKAQKTLWSSIYSWTDKPEVMSVGINTPIFDAKGNLRGVIGIDLVLTQIQSFLKRMQVSPTSCIFIVERDGLLVASSTPEPPYRLVDGKGERLPAIAARDRRIQGITQALNQRFGQLATIQTAQTLKLTLDGQSQFVQVTPWQDERGLSWLIVAVIPESDFMAEINANTQSTILLCFVALVIAIILGYWTTQWITRPLRQLTRSAQTLASASRHQQAWQTWSPVDMATNLSELNVLANAFNTMAQQLQTSFTALEASHQTLEQRVVDRTQELTAALQNLQQMQAHLVHTEKMSGLGQMIAGIAHEINNPVGFIHTNLDYAEQYLGDLLHLLSLYQAHYPQPVEAIQSELEELNFGFVQQDLPKLLASMQQGTTRIRDIVLSLRNFSRLDEAAMKQVNLHEGLDSTLMMIQNRLQLKVNHATVKVLKQYGELPLVECYAGQLNQVFWHLIENAIDGINARATAVTSGQITITTQVEDLSWVTITIADNGIGIPAAVQSRIFDPFFTTKPIGQGTGLGLSISYQVVVKQHCGELNCISVEGEGTQFQLRIPVCQRQKSKEWVNKSDHCVGTATGNPAKLQ